MAMAEKAQRLLHWFRGFTPYKRVGLILAAVAIGGLLLLQVGNVFNRVKTYITNKQDAALLEKVKVAEARANDAHQLAVELQLKVIEKGNQLAAAEKRAELAETALQDARRDTARVRLQYEKARTNRDSDVRTVNDLCARLEALNSPCR
jgi:hypothetical protein